MTRVVRILLLTTVAIFAASPARNTAAAGNPQRIVSINVCTDQLLVSLVDRSRIASLSHLAADPYTSWIGAEVEDIPLNQGIAEEVIALNPDLVITVSFSFRPTVAILERFSYPIVELPMASNFADIEDNLRVLGKAAGETQRADALIAELQTKIDRLTYRGEDPRPLFISYEVDGWTTGKGSLVADIARRAGFETAADRLAFFGGRRISLEQLLVLRPDLIDLGHPWDDPPALASESLRHPALQALLQATPVVDVPDPLWMCGSLRTVEALALLRAARDRLAMSAQR